MKILAGIFLLGLILRIVFLDIAPPGFNADEAALGYNAYSLIKTGKDEWGISFPMVFKSFSDYKPGLYVYLDIPFVAILGLNEFAVRLPSILLGSTSIILIYLLSKELFKKESAALSSAFLLSISPWHLHFSRGAWEANVATFFILLGVLTFIKSFKKSFFLWISAVAFISAMYTYQSARLVVPTLVFFLVIFCWRELLVKKNIKVIIFALILLIPLIFILPTSAGLARFKGVSMFSDLGPLNRINELRGQDQDPSSYSAKFFHNKIQSYANSFFIHYLDHFSFDFLFLTGGSLKRNKEPDMGELYIFEIITIVSGLYFLIRHQQNISFGKKLSNTRLVFIWLIIAPLASSLTYQTPDAHRAHNMLVPLGLISGLGLGILLENIRRFNKLARYIGLGLAILIIGFSMAIYFDKYYNHLPKEYPLEWEYGFSQVIPYVMNIQDKYQKIVITDRYDQPYVLLLFYSKYDPIKYQGLEKVIGDNKFGFSTINSFEKYEFRPIAKEEISKSKNTLFIGTKEEIGDNVTPLKVINFPNGMPAFKVIGT